MNPVNLFFACDNAYVPFLAVTLTSLKENCNPKRDYALRILHTGLDPENIRRLTDSFASDGFTMEFIDITQAVEQFAGDHGVSRRPAVIRCQFRPSCSPVAI